MIGTLILSHGRLADELLAAGRTIAGGLDAFEAVSLDWSETYEQAQTKIRESLDRLDQGNGVLILTDMFGGTPCNIALTFMEPGKVEIVTGVNLPMVVRLGCLGSRERPLSEVARWLREKTRGSICVASDVQSGRPAACADQAPDQDESDARPVGAAHEGGE
jgi:PTS system mannose-specific IIA component